eukprot:TRINITY_DN3199_c0_g1_i1.p1 TRINITY_DN3199_c0_g1~~TRINITY_DN3199_c0_g1_i1.p1  ORF type:complete len:472 (+),score=102.54 TRINITY_DN3199_c0_g1_i1:23-1417(+)
MANAARLLIVIAAFTCAKYVQASNVTFGHALLDQFMLESGFVNLNHGSFGAVPKVVHEAQLDFTRQAEARPDDWFRGGYQTILGRMRSQLSSYVNASADDLVFVENVSAAINAVLRSLATGPDDTFLVLSCAYAMVSNTLLWLQEQKRAKLLVVDIQFPIQGDADVLAAVRQVLEQHKQNNPSNPIKMAVFSHIVSIPAIRLPIEELSTLAKQHNVQHIMVDGAHALGHIDIDIAQYQQAGVDLYTSNGHKWLFCPKGTAFLWTSPQLHPSIAPTVVSSDWAAHDYMRDFLYTGTRDYTPFASVEAAFNFRQSLGGDAAIRQYMVEQARQGAKELVAQWSTRLAAPINMSDAMLTVELPACLGEQAATLMSDMAQEYNIQIVVFQMPTAAKSIGGSSSALYPSQSALPPDCADSNSCLGIKTSRKDNEAAQPWWVRISAQVYTELDDIRRVGDIVNELCDKRIN